jgi:hypothetical protein
MGHEQQSRGLSESGLLTALLTDWGYSLVKIIFRHLLPMQEQLEKEGVKIKDDQVVDFKKLFWDPIKEC